MIVRNEEQNLAACLSPVASAFAEIVVIDTGSSDRTKEIAGQFTSRIFDFAWCDDFSAARNQSLRHATGNWVFWLDADDRLDDQNAARLKELLLGLPDLPAVFFMDTICAPSYECEDARLISHCRLFRRHPALAWSGRIHEQLRPHPNELGYELLASDVQIQHVGYRDTAACHRKVQRDIRLLRMDYAVNPGDISTRLHLGLAYARLGNSTEAQKWLQPLLRSEQAPADYLRQVYGVLTDLALRDGQFTTALETVVRGRRLFPVDEYLCYLQAEALYELDRYDLAKQILTRLVEQPKAWQFRAGAPNQIKEKLAPRRLADVLRMQGDIRAAETILLQILDRFPGDTITWHTLGQTYLYSQQWHSVRTVVEKLRACPQGQIFADLLLAALHIMQGELDTAEVLVDWLIAAVPQMPLPRILRVEILGRRQTPRPALLQACRDLLRVQPANVEAAQLIARLQAPSRPQPPVATPNFSTSLVLGSGIPGGVVAAG
jgi:tetratricopeptide (TPR) repeat protein